MSDWRTRWQAEMADYRRRWIAEPVYHINEARWRLMMNRPDTPALDLLRAFGKALLDIMDSRRYDADDLPGERDRLLRMIDPGLVLPSGLST